MATLVTFDIDIGSTDVLERSVMGTAFAVVGVDFDYNAILDNGLNVPELRVDHKDGTTYPVLEGAASRRPEIFRRLYLDPKGLFFDEWDFVSAVGPISEQRPRTLRASVLVWDHRGERIDIDAVRTPAFPVQTVERGITDGVPAGTEETASLLSWAPYRPLQLTALKILIAEDTDFTLELYAASGDDPTTTPSEGLIATFESPVGGPQEVSLADFDADAPIRVGAYQTILIRIVNGTDDQTEITGATAGASFAPAP
jgi:hypothetical protein